MGRGPDFFILGAVKAETSKLYECVRLHPDVFVPSVKEPHFFEVEKYYARGFDGYLKLFQGARDESAVGEAAPSCLYHPEKVIPRMLATSIVGPESRFVATLRTSVDRAWLHFQYRVRNQQETESCDSALELEGEHLVEGPRRWVGYFHDDQYHRQLSPWIETFRPYQFPFLLTEDLRDFDAIQERLFACLGVDEAGAPPVGNTVFNPASNPRSRPWMRFLARPSWLKAILPKHLRRRMASRVRFWNLTTWNEKAVIPPEVVANLWEGYRDQIVRTAEAIGRDLSHWLRLKPPVQP